MNTIKNQLYLLCLAYANQRLTTAQEAIQVAQHAANQETKSSAGDKYETGRAMAQLEIEQNRTQVMEAQNLIHLLTRINPANQTRFIQNGSVVSTSQGDYFIAIAAGRLTLGDRSYFAVSEDSPIGKQLIGRSVGNRFVFNNNEIIITSVE